MTRAYDNGRRGRAGRGRAVRRRWGRRRIPAEPLAGLDRVFAVDVTPRVDGAGTVESAQRAELARRSRERLGESLSLIEPIPPEELHGSAFYDLFLDRRRWPDLMRRGYSAAAAALDPFRGRKARS